MPLAHTQHLFSPSKAGCVSTTLVLAFGMLLTDRLVMLPWFGRLQGCHFLLLQGKASGLRRLQSHLPAKPIAGKEQQLGGRCWKGGAVDSLGN